MLMCRIAIFVCTILFYTHGVLRTADTIDEDLLKRGERGVRGV